MAGAERARSDVEARAALNVAAARTALASPGRSR
jgi:hypothetical protein